MAKLVVLITAQIESAHVLAEAWRQAGAPGVTLIQGHGLQRLRAAAKFGEVLPGTLSMMEILSQTEISSVLLISLVEHAALANGLLEVTQSVLGDLEHPGNGVAFVIDVERAIGIRHHPDRQT